MFRGGGGMGVLGGSGSGGANFLQQQQQQQTGQQQPQQLFDTDGNGMFGANNDSGAYYGSQQQSSHQPFGNEAPGGYMQQQGLGGYQSMQQQQQQGYQQASPMQQLQQQQQQLSQPQHLAISPMNQQQQLQQQQQNLLNAILHGPVAITEYLQAMSNGRGSNASSGNGGGGTGASASVSNSATSLSGGGSGGGPAGTAPKISDGPTHHQLQQLRHQQSSQGATPHFHARQAAQAARASAAQTKSASSTSLSSGNGQTSMEEEPSPIASPAPAPATPPGKQRGITIIDPVNRKNVLEQNAQKYASAAELASRGLGFLLPSGDRPPGESWAVMDLGGMAIHTLSSTSSIFTTYAFLTGLYLNHNNLQMLPASIKHLRCLVLLDVSANKLHWLPPEVGDLRRLRELWAFDNYIESLPWEVAWLRSLEFLGLEGNPIMKGNPVAGGTSSMENIFDVRKSMRYENPIAEILVRDGVQALISWLRDNMPIDVMLPSTLCNRRWIRRNTKGDGEDKRREGGTAISLLSYNILCERYATRQQYWYTPTWSLNWSYRKERIYKEIVELDADVICLQEVDWAQYDDWLLPRLSAHGYAASFLPKSRFRTMSEKMKKSPGGGVDGCATFWKTNKLRQVGTPMVVEFAQLALGRSDFAKNDTMFERFCSKDNIALGVVLESVTGHDSAATTTPSAPHRFFVVNVHIHWDPAQTDVKLVQSVMLMDEIGKYTAKFMREHPQVPRSSMTIPTLISGDFNSLPNGLVYDFLSNPGGVRDVGKHADLTECFAAPLLPTPADTTEDTDTVKESAKDEKATGKAAVVDDEQRVQLKRWLSWRESGYGEIARSEVLKHALSGSLCSAYKGVEGVPVEGANLYIPPAHVLSSTTASDERGPPTYPIPALPFTNHTENFTGVIDYIWYTSDDFDVDGVLGGYLLEDNVGRDMVRWIREGQANEDPAQHYANATLASFADLHEHHPSIGIVSPSNTPVWNDSLLLVDASADPYARPPPQPKVWSVRGTKMLGFPNPVFPSDHIPVMVELYFCPAASKHSAAGGKHSSAGGTGKAGAPLSKHSNSSSSGHRNRS